MFEEKIHGNLRYILRYPENYSADKQYPTIIYLHGAGTRGNNIEILKSALFFSSASELNNFPFIVAAPLCHADTWFDLYESLCDFVDLINNRPDVDKSKFYALGASMGGYATWQLAMSKPELFTAIIPICGGGMYWNAKRLVNIPIWAFHGDSDTTVFTEESVKMVNAVNSYGGNAKLTIYENCDHDSWSATFSNKEVFEWLLAQEKIDAKVESNGFNDSKIYG